MMVSGLVYGGSPHTVSVSIILLLQVSLALWPPPYIPQWDLTPASTRHDLFFRSPCRFTDVMNNVIYCHYYYLHRTYHYT